MTRAALRFAGLLIVVLTVLRIPDYISRFLVTPDRSFLIFAMVAFAPLAISLLAGFILWVYADALSRLVEAPNQQPRMELREEGYQRLLGVGIALVGVFVMVEAASDLAFWIGRYFQMKKGMPHVDLELGEEFISIFSTAVKAVLAGGLILYGRKAAAQIHPV